MVYAEGNPEAEGYLNKDNQNAASLKMNVFRIQLLGSKNDNSGNSAQNNSYQPAANKTTNQPVTDTEEPADDLPF